MVGMILLRTVTRDVSVYLCTKYLTLILNLQISRYNAIDISVSFMLLTLLASF
jgi:hypothetical protein